MSRIKIALAGAVCAALGAMPAKAAEYKVGILLPFSGVYAGIGSDIETGFQLALEHFGERLGEHSIETVREDTEAKPNVGLAKAKKLVLQDEVDVLAGVVSSGVLGGLRDFVHNAKVPLVVANAGNDLMTGEQCSPYVVRVSFSNSMINRPMGPWMFDQGIRKVYVMAADYAAGHQMAEAFKQTFTAAGGEIVGEAYPPFQETKDYAPFLTTAKAANPDAIYVFFAGGEAITFVKQYASFGLKDSIPLFGAGFLTSPAYVDVQGEAADGVIAGLHYVPTIDTPENQRFQEAFQATSDGRKASEFAVQGYDAGRLIIEAINQAGGDKEAFKQALSEVSFTGPRGPLRIDPATNNVIQNIYVFRNVYNGETVDQEILDVAESVQDEPQGCEL